jgi:nucleosome-remodeling factor subunit BPTF
MFHLFISVFHEKSVAAEASDSNDQSVNSTSTTNGVEQASTDNEIPIDKNDQTHLTRSRTNQISNGTFYFKLGMENLHKEYINQFVANPLALNKPQKNEERDKKRHLSHKFSLTDASIFKWGGLLNGTEHSLIAVFKQSLLTFESSIPPPFMHCNWSKLRKVWLNAVATATTAQDFIKVLIVLQTSFKNVLFANVWHEQLGHIHLYRITSTEREERKKIEKREKREENEEERNRLAYNYVKYSLGLRHQVWKQKGEEYRIHGQWGWLWSSRTRRRQYWSEIRRKRIQSVNIVVRKGEERKVMSLKRQAYENFTSAIEFAKTYIDKQDDQENKNNEDEDEDMENKRRQQCEAIKEIDVENVLGENAYDSIDISEALKAKTRLVFPKIAKKSSLDDLLERREKLRDLELKVSLLKDNSETPEIPENIIPTVSVESTKKKSWGSTVCISKIIQDITDNKARVTNQKSKNFDLNEKCIKIHQLQMELDKIQKMLKNHRCFSEQCRKADESSLNVISAGKTKCFSVLCQKENQLQDEIGNLIQQLRDKFTGTGKKGILHQKLAEAKNNDLLDILNKYHLGDYMLDENFQYSIEACIDDIFESIEEAVDFDASLISSSYLKVETKTEEEEAKLDEKKELDENGEPEIKEESGIKSKETKTEDLPVRQPNRRFLAITKPKKEIELEKELDADGKEKVYSTVSTAGKIYLKKLDKVPTIITSNEQTQQQSKDIISRYPAISTFTTVKNTKSILVLPKYEINRIARRAGKYWSTQFNHQAKNNNSVWPYPCSRPFFRSCWIYRTFCSNTFAALGLQFRILWTCLRWDDMQTKPGTLDGKNQVTTDTEIITTELLKHRNVGPFMECTQYFRRRVVIPLELPKSFREVTSIRSGLRKRKRAESPHQTDPQVNEEWIDEDKMELWEIRQYGERFVINLCTPFYSLLNFIISF